MAILDEDNILLFGFMINSQFLACFGGFHRSSLEELYIAVSSVNHAWDVHKRYLYLSGCLPVWLWITTYWSSSFSKCLRIGDNWMWHLGWVPVCWFYHLYEYISSRGVVVLCSCSHSWLIDGLGGVNLRSLRSQATLLFAPLEITTVECLSGICQTKVRTKHSWLPIQCSCHPTTLWFHIAF